MVTNFENITQPLDRDERRIAKKIGVYLFKYARKGKEVSNNNLRMWLHQQQHVKVKGVRVRAMIHWLRISQQYKWLLANGHGYYYSRDKKELARYKLSLSNRINSIIEVRNSLFCATGGRNIKSDQPTT